MAVIEVPVKNSREEKIARITKVVAENELTDIVDSFSVLHENAQISYLLAPYADDLKKFEEDILKRISKDFFDETCNLKKEKAKEMYEVYADRFGQDIEEFYDEIVKSR